jgi:hypothetical protein
MNSSPTLPDNLLESWKDLCVSQSMIYQFKTEYNIDKILKIYNIMKENFPDWFWKPRKPNEGKIIDGNWLHALLLQPENFSSCCAIMEFAYSVDFMNKHLAENHRKVFFSYLKDVQKLRNAYFEIWTFRLLHLQNKLKTAYPIESDGNTPEGYVMINGKKYLFECKNPVIYGWETLDRFISSFHDLYFQLVNLTREKGILGTIAINKKATGQVREGISKMIGEFVVAMRTNPNLPFPYKVRNDIAEINVSDYNHDLEYAYNLKQDYQVLFRLIPPIIPGYPFSAGLGLHFMVSDTQLKDKLKKKYLRIGADHHQYNGGRIFFFNNELVNDLLFPMWNNEKSFPYEFVKKYYDENYKTEDALVFAFRDFRNESPTVKFIVISADQDLKRVLENLQCKFGKAPQRKYNLPPDFVLLK